jgi:3-hydroxybutyryl-CoA dehydratase
MEVPIIMIKERSSFTVGEEAILTKLVSDDDIKTFARISGDDNPVHMNDDYARGTMFGGRIAHGMLVAGLISAVLGTMLPGPGAVYLSQQLRFRAPVRPGDQVTARARVTDWNPEKGRITLLTDVTNQEGSVVIEGEARLVMSSYLKK